VIGLDKEEEKRDVENDAEFEEILSSY